LKDRIESIFKKNKIATLKDRITNKFLDLCVPETWGVRVGITNVLQAAKFLELLQIDYEN